MAENNQEDLFAPPSEQEIEEILSPPTEEELSALKEPPEVGRLESLLSELGAPTGGVIAGSLTGAAGRGIIRGATPLAQDIAFSALGGKQTRAGKDLIKTSKKGIGLFSPRDVGELALQENLFDADNLEKASRTSREELENILKQVEGAKTPQEITSSFEQKIKEKYPISETKSGEKARKSVKKFSKRFEDAPERTALDLEKMKRETLRDVDFTKEGKVLQDIRKTEADVFREAAEDLVKEYGDDELLNQFKAAKTRGGKMRVLTDIIDEVDIREYAKDAKIDFQDALAITYNRPDILLARKALRNKGIRKNLAKGLSKIGKLTDKIGSTLGKKVVGNLPLIGAVSGAVLGFSSARAEGADIPEALGEAAGSEIAEGIIPGGITGIAGGTRGKPTTEEELQRRLIEEPGYEAPESPRQELMKEIEEPNSRVNQKVKEYKQQGLKHEEAIEKAVNKSLEPGIKREPSSVAFSNKQINKYANELDTPNELDNLIQQFQKLKSPAGNVWSERLEDIKNTEDESTKAQRKFELLQQPGFRKFMDQQGIVDEEE